MRHALGGVRSYFSLNTLARSNHSNSQGEFVLASSNTGYSISHERQIKQYSDQGIKTKYTDLSDVIGGVSFIPHQLLRHGNIENPFSSDNSRCHVALLGFVSERWPQSPFLLSCTTDQVYRFTSVFVFLWIYFFGKRFTFEDSKCTPVGLNNLLIRFRLVRNVFGTVYWDTAKERPFVGFCSKDSILQLQAKLLLIGSILESEACNIWNLFLPDTSIDKLGPNYSRPTSKRTEKFLGSDNCRRS